MAKTGIDMSGFEKFRKLVSEGIRGERGPMDVAFKQWGFLYLGYIRRLFIKNSRGGGEWADLAPSTKRSRRGGRRRKTKSRRARTKTTSRGTGKVFRILRNTGILQKAMSIGGAGNLHTRIRGGIRVGFSDTVKHPDTDFSMAKLAATHDQGNPKGKLPQRIILQEPNGSLSSRMKRVVQKAMNEIGRLSEIE